MIYYFSGTGNSAYVAERLAQSLGEDVRDLGRGIREGAMEPINGETVVIVTPTYCYRLPRIVETYLKNAGVGGERIYFVMTCGSDIGNASHYNEVLARELGIAYGGTLKVTMPENYIAMFDAPGPEEACGIIRRAEGAIQEAREIIAQKKPHPIRSSLLGKCLSAINGLYYALFVKADKFYAKNNCIGCGACAENCVLANIVMEEGRPHWLDRCTHCMACINHCPVEAIEYGNKTRGKFRYTFEKVWEGSCLEK